MFPQRGSAQRAQRAFQEMFKSQNRSLTSHLKLIAFVLCVVVFLIIVLYELYTLSLRNYERKYQELDPLWRQKMNRHFDSNKALTTSPAQSHLSSSIRSQLESHKARPEQLTTERVSLSSLN